MFNTNLVDLKQKSPYSIKTYIFYTKRQQFVQVSYSVLEPRGSDLAECVPRVQIQPVTPLASIPLTHARASYQELHSDDILTMLLPHAALFPRSRIHVPVFLRTKPDFPVSGFIIR